MDVSIMQYGQYQHVHAALHLFSYTSVPTSKLSHPHAIYCHLLIR